MNKKIYLYLVVLVSIFLFGCGKEEENRTIPWAQVNFKVDLNGQDNELTIPTNYKLFTQARLANEYVGFSGLLVVCSPITGSDGSPILYAYDLCCPYEKQQHVKIEILKDGIVQCPNCKSVYDIISGIGNVKSGPSQTRLQVYNVTRDGASGREFRITH